MVIEYIALISLGFIVGLSGAVIPGPLFAFAVFDTCKKGRITGHYVIAGHIMWELLIIILILLGFGWMIQGNSRIIYLAGGIMLAFMGANMLRNKNRNSEVKMEKARVNSSIGGGLFYSIFNPTQPIWWATAGFALLATGLSSIGILGVVLVTAGHWLSDIAYYTFVSYVVHRYKRFVNPRLKQIAVVLGLFVFALGAFFILHGFLS